METIRKRGKVIVPAFAVGRTQELVYALNQFVSPKDACRPSRCMSTARWR